MSSLELQPVSCAQPLSSSSTISNPAHFRVSLRPEVERFIAKIDKATKVTQDVVLFLYF